MEKTNFSMIEQSNSLKSSSSITIRPFSDPASANMGLERYDLVVFDGIVQEEPVKCLEQNGVKRYITGLNEYAPEVKSLPEKEREEKIKFIRRTVSEIERELISNNIDPEDPDFWNKVKILKPDNTSFWEQLKIRVGNKPVYLSPETDVYDRLKIIVLENNGYSLVAKSLEAAKSSNKRYKFYLDRNEETSIYKTEQKKIKNRAIAKLEALYNKGGHKMFYIAKVIDPNGVQYKKTTSPSIIYDALDDYINGRMGESPIQASKRFLDLEKLEIKDLIVKAIIQDASYYQFIVLRSDGRFYHKNTGTPLGKNTIEITQNLEDPVNDSVFGTIKSEVESRWND